MKIYKFLSIVVLGLGAGFPVYAADEPAAQDDPLAAVATACAEDKAKFCSQVTPGNPDRMLACAYAHEDKLSGACSFALYEAAAALEEAAAAVVYIAESCIDDAETYCGEVRLGEGRVLSCLADNKSKISATCTTAIEETVGFDD
jgi:hypothetical protein